MPLIIFNAPSITNGKVGHDNGDKRYIFGRFKAGIWAYQSVHGASNDACTGRYNIQCL